MYLRLVRIDVVTIQLVSHASCILTEHTKLGGETLGTIERPKTR